MCLLRGSFAKPRENTSKSRGGLKCDHAEHMNRYKKDAGRSSSKICEYAIDIKESIVVT